MHVLGDALARKPPPSDFSDPGLAKLLELQTQYIEDVGLEAIRRARRNGSDLVSAVDIDNGDRAVRAGGARKAWAEAFGGILAGAGTGTFLQIAVETHPSTLGLSIAAILAAIGLIITTAALFGQR